MGNSDSHVVFIDGVKRLLAEDVPETDQDFWTALFLPPMSIEDIFEIVGPDHVRQLRQKRPLNLQVLLRRTTAKMAELCQLADEGRLDPAAMTAANTAVRLLTRVVPFLLEDPRDEVVRELLWRPGGLQKRDDEEKACPAEEDVVREAETVPPELPEAGTGQEKGPIQAEAKASEGAASTPIGCEILHYVNRFLFLPGYTVTSYKTWVGDTARTSPPAPQRVDARMVWKGGVGISGQMPQMPTTAQFYRARSEVLRCLLACLSGPLFQSAEEYQDSPPAWLLHFTGGDVCHTGNLFCSLMATVFSYDPVGWGVPYGGYLANGTEEDLVDVALQVLCVIMDFDHHSGQDSAAAEEEQEAQEENEEDEQDEEADNQPSSPAQPERAQKPGNVYRQMLQRVSKDAEIDLIFGGLVRLLSTVHQANQTYLPSSFRSVGFYQEALVLLWHLLTTNAAFTRRVVDCLDPNQVLLPVLYLLQQAQHAPQLVGLLHTASFVLLVLSSQRSFAVQLNEAYKSKVPLQIPQFVGCHADVVALTLHRVISDAMLRPQSDALVEMLLTVLCNVSPYVKCFALESCLKILSLVERCSRPSYLFRSAFTHHGLVFLLEMLNNIVQYQFEGNAMMVYSILRQQDCVRQLAALQLRSGGLSPGGAEGGSPQEPEPGPNRGWAPTEAWLESVKRKLPLKALLCLVDHLTPQIHQHCRQDDVTDQDAVLRYLRQTTLVGILPVPHPIVIRTYQASSYTAMWFSSYMWGVIFTRSQRMPLYDWRKIRLVVINQ